MNKLLEASRQELLAKSVRGQNYKDTSKGKNRYVRRNLSKIIKQVKNFNDIDMDNFFKQDILTVGINVIGETSNYNVKIKFGGILRELKTAIIRNNNILDFKTIIITLIRIFNTGDVYIHCSCPDFAYRFSYWCSKNNYNSGAPETRASNITNPNDKLGAGCKHTLLVLANIDWLMKVASVINNYIIYMQKNQEQKYAKFIHHTLYDTPYEYQQSIFDNNEKDLETDSELLDKSNEIGAKRGQFQPGNPYRFKKDPNKPASSQLKIGIEDEDETPQRNLDGFVKDTFDNKETSSKRNIPFH